MKDNAILIVAGEPNSIFLEIFFKSLKKNYYKNPLIIIVCKKLLIKQMNHLGFNFMINELDLNDINFKKLNNDKINIINVNYNFINAFEKISKKSNNYIKKSFDIAIKILRKNKFSKLINGPISKKHFLEGKILGITEYLANESKKNEFAMLIFNKKISVSPLTTHLALKDVHKHISKKKIYIHIKLIAEFYKKNFKRNPKIAITGLNPHCESNFVNSEENTIIKPAIKNLKIKNYKIEGPFPADTIFMKKNLNEFDVIVGMYHDQVLTPMKALFGFDAINITLGLPFIRISPDHGPNSSMLGKNLSDPKSLIEALKFLDK
ncbi:4-hydroxythreonine-4-phosphate dehydrogenase PdxA [Candidatus Pelagibacter sp. Uisw_099_02]|uniref:4-hydroxythreonine-4-phosphate dehydrogenase PdxA n=1 Tax=Candidatus Pelagibacter sp. Uisw_099_02 TaxID=3230981 RepID=UPI0039EC8317